MPGLMYPAYQKFYSAISCLARFQKEHNFFENISCLDTFLSEYRSITLVMQKSLAHTPHIETYRNLIATECLDPWLNVQRVKSVHTHPIEFTKKVDISIYFPDREINILSKSFSVEDDVPLSTLNDDLKELFTGINPIEVFFSAKCSFPEKDTGEDVLHKALLGIDAMLEFMDKMYLSIEEDCPLCNQLRSLISNSRIVHTPIDFLAVDDYVYYPIRDEFEYGGRIVGMFEDSPIPPRSALERLDRIPSLCENDYFQKFVIMHILIGSTDLMPTFMVVYKDRTFQLITFHASIKTTFYRKINEIASTIVSDDVQEVYFMMTYVVCDSSEENMLRNSKERLSTGKEEILTFMKVDSDLNEEEYAFESALLCDQDDLARKFVKGPRKKLNFGANNMAPIVLAFKTKKEEKNQKL